MRKSLLLFSVLFVLFFSNCKKEEIAQSYIEYPSSGLYGDNILDTIRRTYLGVEFSLAANLYHGAVLKIKITALGNGIWFYAAGAEQNWVVSDFNELAKSQVFTAIDGDRNCDLQMEFNSGQYRIEYFESNSGVPSRGKVIEK